MVSYLLHNIAGLVAAVSDNGKPLRGSLQGKLEVIRDAFLLIQDGKIAGFGNKMQMPVKRDHYMAIDMQQSLLMPAFVDPHTHLVFAGSREEEFLMRLQGASYLDILSKGYGIHQTVINTENASFDELLTLAKTRLRNLERYGTIGIEMKSGYGLQTDTELKQLRVIKTLKNQSSHPIRSTYLAAHAIPALFKYNREKYLQQIIEETLPQVAEEGLADFVDVFCEKDVFSVEECERILERGAALGLKPKLHTDEFYSIGGVSLAARVNAVSADHMITPVAEEVKKLQDTDTVAVILPGTSFSMAHTDKQYARRLIDAGIPLAIGTDYNPGTCMCYSQQIMMELSVLLFGLTIYEAINAVTVNASFAAGLDDITGMIKVGYRADLLSMKVKTVEEIPYTWGINKVNRIFLSGEMIEFDV